ncbi:IS1595 family transposase [Ancylobacter amanitiformis]|uniref:Transposase-like protein/DNA-directed RNA polymerase subunit RPC12/RpoP n=1 Tax=Ancylobacter amanitiformis TaxID=217069 RepID=A0ABU0LQM6_9HYPH|nr:IS1595 family transposase [Ancylobacter amanitiformis]MDQ0510963.1 transposase-like protein/DNA-directed RNA polymerase subunit RPC12/RpoP [Ancylobacter amanitiformis]
MSSEKLTVSQFFARFPNDEVCLNHIMEVRYGMRHVCERCGKEATFHKITDRRAFACAACGVHVYPCAGTIFQDSRTSLQTWFYAIYLFVVTRHGVSGKELERALGVTYKTAWRMGQQIRQLMEKADGFAMLQGHVEADEAYVGGHRPGKRGRGAAGKTIVMGMKERGGRLTTEVIPDVKKATLRDVVNRNVEPGSVVSTDELMSYGLLTGDGYVHGSVKHGAKEWAYYDYRHGATHSTNSVEAFWRLFKASVRSTHIHVSGKYMGRYLSEFSFRSNHREMKNAMFDLLIGAI